MLETIDVKYLLHLRHYFVLQFIGYIVKSFNIWGGWVGQNNFEKQSKLFNIDYSGHKKKVSGF